MEWENRNLEDLEAINFFDLNPGQQKFYNAMTRFASIGIIPSKAQLIFVKRLADKSRQKCKQQTIQNHERSK